MSFEQADQGSMEWILARVGMITASRMNDVMAKIKSGEAATRKGYRTELAVERISGLPTERFVSGPMKWGTENEPFARAAYSIATGFEVEEVGFIACPSVPRAGCSPDGLVGIDGGIEAKCPNTATHIEWAVAGKVPTEHRLQMQFCMFCTGRDWWDFVSFDPRMPDCQQLFIRRLYRDEKVIKELIDAVLELDGEVEYTVADLLKVVWCETSDKD